MLKLWQMKMMDALTVCGKNYRAARILSAHLRNHFPHEPPAHRIHTRRRLVQKHYGWTTYIDKTETPVLLPYQNNIIIT